MQLNYQCQIHLYNNCATQSIWKRKILIKCTSIFFIWLDLDLLKQVMIQYQIIWIREETRPWKRFLFNKDIQHYISVTLQINKKRCVRVYRSSHLPLAPVRAVLCWKFCGAKDRGLVTEAYTMNDRYRSWKEPKRITLSGWELFLYHCCYRDLSFSHNLVLYYCIMYFVHCTV